MGLFAGQHWARQNRRAARFTLHLGQRDWLDSWTLGCFPPTRGELHWIMNWLVSFVTLLLAADDHLPSKSWIWVFALKAAVAAVAILCLVVFIPATDFGKRKNSDLVNCGVSLTAKLIAFFNSFLWPLLRLEWLWKYPSSGRWPGCMGFGVGCDNGPVLLWLLGSNQAILGKCQTGAAWYIHHVACSPGCFELRLFALDQCFPVASRMDAICPIDLWCIPAPSPGRDPRDS